MPRFLAEPPFNHSQYRPKVGILLLNLGTPDAPTPAAVRRYLAEFLSDQRVVELPKLLWRTLLYGVILPLRSRQSAAKYQKIWFAEGSPLAVYTARQADLLRQQLSGSLKRDDLIVAHAMSYGQPAISDTIQTLKQQGVNRLLVLPLFPQYAGSSTGAALDKVWAALQQQRNQMAVRSISRYPDDPEYIHALASHIQRYWAAHGRGQKLLLSFHGVPLHTLHAGDPYFCECHKTARLLAQALSLGEHDYVVAFQSRFGKAKWVGPSTQTLLAELPRTGTTQLDVFCPGFSSDCLETLEEIALEGKETFHAAGGRQYHYIPCLNTEPEWINCLTLLVRTHLSGWDAEPIHHDNDHLRQQRQDAARAHLNK